MLPVDPALLNALAPPCIGAFIGYLTNKIAIRMLFRPLRPWHLFGVRVPMTPGIIPSRRHQLAVNIGEMVGRHLLSARDIGAAISQEPFQEHLSTLADLRVNEILRRELGSLPDIVPERFKAYVQIGVKTLKYYLGEGVNRYLASDEFTEKMTASIESRLEALAERDLNRLISPEGRQSLYLFIDQVIKDLLGGGATEQWLGLYLAESLRRSAARGQSVADLLPDGLAPLLRELIRAQTGAMLAKMGAQLADPVLRQQVIKGILAGAEHFLDSLGPVGAMARGFLEMDTFEHKVGEYLDTREEDLIAWLGKPEVQERMTTVLIDQVEGWLAKPLADLLADMDEDRFAAVCGTCASQLLAALRTEGTLTGLNAMLHVAMEDLLDSGKRPIGELARQFFPGDSGRMLKDTVVQECIELFRSSRTERLVNAMVGAMVDSLLARPIGKLANIVPHGIRQGISEYIVHTANRMFLREVPGVVESLNIQRVVTEKVDSLNLLQLERLLLSIMEEQFKYINLFGALLGFLLGLLNLAVARFV